MSNRKVFTDSVTPLPDEPGMTTHGLMVNTTSPQNTNEPMRILFSLSLPTDKQADLEARVARGEVVPPARLKKDYVADAKDTQSLVDWLKTQDFTNVEVSPNGTGVYASATAAQIQKSLQVDMVRVTRDGITYTAAKNAPSLPEEVAQSVRAILGLQPFRHANKHRILPIHLRNDQPTPNLPGVAMAAAPAIDNAPPYVVSEILKAYNADNLGVTGKGQTIAILIDTFPNDSDLTAFWNKNGLSVGLGQIQKINVNTATLPVPEGEETLDTEWTSGIAPGATIRIYASGSLQFVDLDKALDMILDDIENIPGMRQLSISLGLGEKAWSGMTAESATEHQKFLRLAAAGVNVFVSSGDGGSSPDGNSRSSDGPPQVEYASSDPCVIGVGGTSLVLAADGSAATETGWANGGGGISVLFSQPVWQKGAGVLDNKQRQVPDVSLTADPNYGALVILNGSEQQIGGTSWSAPTWAGFCALINEARGKAGRSFLPFLNPLIYPLWGSSSFRDIESGSNGAFTATAGYDMVTGIGVPNVKNLLAALLATP